MTSMRNWILALVLALVSAPQAFAAEVAAKVVMLTGKATAVGADGTVRSLAKEDPVYSGELINSGPGSYVNLRFADGAFFLLRPGTRFAIENYRYSPTAESSSAKPATPPASGTGAATPPPLVTAQASGSSEGSRAFFRLLKGGFRAVSGVIGKVNREDYRVSTPVATIGIRGTRYGVRLCQSECSDIDEILSKLRAAGRDAKAGETILVTTVEEGKIAIQTKTAEDLQTPGSTRIVGEDGSITETDSPPSTERNDQDLNPESCGTE